MGFANLRVHHVHPPASKRDSSSCTSFYKSPQNGASVDALVPLNVAWDASCLPSGTANTDIYILTPGNASLAPHVWNNVPAQSGNYTLQLQPRWWSDAAAQILQLAIVPASTPLALAEFPAGPVFTATYTPPADGHVPAIADLNPTPTATAGLSSKHHLSPGKTAVAVLFPLFFLAGLGVLIFLRRQRAQTKADTRRFSAAIDRRMSTLSTDWKSVTPAGASAAIRASMAGDNNRFSTAIPDPTAPPMAQLRTGTGVGLRNPAALAAERASRVSRVSFAATEHPRLSRASIAATATDYSRYSHALPPLPPPVAARFPDSPAPSTSSTSSPAMSPRQALGPLTLTPDDIRARMREEETEKDEGGKSSSAPSLPPLQPSSPITGPASPFLPPASASSTVVLSPDDMLRAYAERQRAAASPAPGTSSPKPKGRTLSLRVRKNSEDDGADNHSPYVGMAN